MEPDRRDPRRTRLRRAGLQYPDQHLSARLQRPAGLQSCCTVGYSTLLLPPHMAACGLDRRILRGHVLYSLHGCPVFRDGRAIHVDPIRAADLAVVAACAAWRAAYFAGPAYASYPFPELRAEHPGDCDSQIVFCALTGQDI